MSAKTRKSGNSICKFVTFTMLNSPSILMKISNATLSFASSSPISFTASSILLAVTSILPVFSKSVLYLFSFEVLCWGDEVLLSLLISIFSILLLISSIVTSFTFVVLGSISSPFNRWYSPSTSCKSSPSSISMILSSVIFSVYPTGIAKCSPPALIVMSISLFKS